MNTGTFDYDNEPSQVYTLEYTCSRETLDNTFNTSCRYIINKLNVNTWLPFFFVFVFIGIICNYYVIISSINKLSDF